MREIVPDVLTWPWFSERHGYDFNGYLVVDAAGNVCIDPVEPTADALEALVRRGVACIVLTNRNHFRSAQLVAERTGARVLVHPMDAPFVRSKGVQVHGELLPGQRVGPFTVVAAAGKSPGEIALHWPERRILLVGDACVGKPPGELALLPAAVIDDLPALRASLRRLCELDFDALLVGDGAPVLSGARQALQRLVATFPA